MDFFRVAVSLADVYAEPESESERVTQAVLATPARRQAQTEGWSLVDLPDYRGWIRSREIVPAAAVDARTARLVTAPRAEAMIVGSNRPLVLYAGTVLPEVQRSAAEVLAALPDGRTIRLDPASTRPVEAGPVRREDAIAELLAFARRFLGAPYLWGGWTVAGIDCSGLIQLAYRLIGCSLPRDAGQQYVALPLDVTGSLLPGDLVFFGARQQVGHVGIVTDQGGFLHASGVAGRVLISNLSMPADEVDRHYAAQYVGARRVLPGV